MRARERPLREVGSIEKRDCGVPGSNDPGVGKSTSGERNGETSGASQCGARYRACRWRARLGIGSLGTTSFLSHWIPALRTETLPVSLAPADRRCRRNKAIENKGGWTAARGRAKENSLFPRPISRFFRLAWPNELALPFISGLTTVVATIIIKVE